MGLASALIVAAACSNQSAAPPRTDPTVPTAPPQTTTTNPYAIPPVIDAAYVNRVLEGLDHAQGEVVRLIVRTRTIPPEAIERLKTLYASRELLQREIDGYQDELRGGLANFRPEPGNTRTTVIEMISNSSTCLYFKVDRDYSLVSDVANPAFRTQWIALVSRSPSGSDVSGYNPTPWAFIYEGFTRNLTAPARNPCDAA
jgi:hypothetical protein